MSREYLPFVTSRDNENNRVPHIFINTHPAEDYK